MIQTQVNSLQRCSLPRSGRMQAGRQAHQPRRCLANRASKLLVVATATAKTYTKATLNTTKTCKLGVSVYPIFGYNASGGGGAATVETLDDGLLKLVFDTTQLHIPSLNWRTATLFGVPIPPPLNIAIKPSRLEGTVNLVTGLIELEFDALFDFSAKPFYSAPSLVVKTLLTTETVKGRQRGGSGRRLAADGSATLVGVAQVERVDDMFMDNFLMLPADALAIMDAQFTFE